jgi:predicted nucleotidyltransferase
MSSVDLKALHDELTSWSAKAISNYGAQAVYLFGSLIHKHGAQFMESSDIDLVVVIPTFADAIERHRWLESFFEMKEELELALFRLLKRSGNEPSASIVAVTELEMAADVHKDGHREFFSANTFRDLSSGKDAVGLPGVAVRTVDRFVASGLAFAQKMRNEFFAVSANRTPRLVDYDGDDPLPKRVMRAAAMAAKATGKAIGPGAEHDVQEGLDLLTNVLYARRDDNPGYFNLQDLLSVRRRARGVHRAVEPTHHLLLSEIIYDLVRDVAGLPDKGNDSGKSRESDDNRSESEGDRGEGGSDDAGAGGTEPGLLPELGPTPHVYDGDAAPTNETSEKSRGVATYTSSTALFAERFAAAFPGVRGTSWHTEPADIAERLRVLLAEPLSFAGGGTPIWWWRGGNLQIERFRKLPEGLFLMNVEELKIVKLAAVTGSTYQRYFVYVETAAMEPTGLYPTRIKDLDARLRQNGYDYEEYGLFRGEIPVSRSHYDDGAMMIDGRLVDIYQETELRIRYTTPYNFLIAANGSPINNIEFDKPLEEILNFALDHDAEACVERLKELVDALPLRDMLNS